MSAPKIVPTRPERLGTFESSYGGEFLRATAFGDGSVLVTVSESGWALCYALEAEEIPELIRVLSTAEVTK